MSTKIYDAYKFAGSIDLIKTQSTSFASMYSDVYDVRGSVVVYFHKKKIYVQTFLGKPHPEFTDQRFEDFHYQDQGDPWYTYEENLNFEEKKFLPKTGLVERMFGTKYFLHFLLLFLLLKRVCVMIFALKQIITRLLVMFEIESIKKKEVGA